MSRQYYDDLQGSSRRINASSRRHAPTSDFVSHSTFQPNRQRYSSSLLQPVPPSTPPTYYPSSYGEDYSSYNGHANPRGSSVNRLNYPTNAEVNRRYVLETPPSHSRVSQYPQHQPQSYNNDYYHSPRYQSSSHHSNQNNYSRHESSDQYNRRDRREDPQPSRSYPIQSQRRSIDVPIVRQSSTSSRPSMPLQVRNPTSLLAQFLQGFFGEHSTPFHAGDDDDEGVNRSFVNPVDLIAFALMVPGSGAITIPSAIHIQFGDFLDLLAHDEPPTVGLSENEIKHIPITTYRKTNKSKSEEEKCAVCLSNYKNGEKVKRLRCKHIFHPDCIDPWLKTSTQCPICRGSQSN